MSRASPPSGAAGSSLPTALTPTGLEVRIDLRLAISAHAIDDPGIESATNARGQSSSGLKQAIGGTDGRRFICRPLRPSRLPHCSPAA